MSDISINLKDILDEPTLDTHAKIDGFSNEFKQTKIYKRIMKNFDDMHQFFTEEYNKYLQEEASSDDFFDDF